MANEPITFSCPACGIRLTVPGSLAGVIGPCPTCRTQIQAPCPPPPIPQAALGSRLPPNVQAGYQQVALPVQQHQPVLQAAYEPLTVPIPLAVAPNYQAPALTQIVAPIPLSSPAVLRPEPRQLPSRSNHAEPVAKQMPEPNYTGHSSKSSRGDPRQTHRKNRFFRFLIPMLFLMASVAIGFGVATLLKNPPSDAAGNVPGKSSGSRSILPPEPVTNKTSDTPLPQSIPSLPVPAPDLPAIIEPVPALSDGLEPKSPSDVAREVLDAFLAAKSLAERLPLMETRTPEPELANSCLARPFPAASKISIEAIENNAVEQVVDYYHNLDFDAGNNRFNPQTILVRTRGSAEPKVVVDPLLDSYGGRFAAYAKTPSDRAAIFQVIIWPLAACYDERVPDREKKLTLKIVPQDNAKEIALAYFGRQSKIAQMLEDGTYSLSYGKAKACTVMFRWNTEDDPGMPYLEAVALKTLDWNP